VQPKEATMTKIKIYLDTVRECWLRRDFIADDVLYEADYMARFDPGGWIRPTPAGARLYALWEVLVTAPLTAVRQASCKHPNMIDESWSGPDSGGDGGTCPDCDFSFHHVYY